jgi:nucleotide-binding universal stress UspA family protein
MTAIEMIAEEIDAAQLKTDAKKPFSLVVATDGSDAADAAFTAARLIEKKSGCRVHVVTVLEPLPIVLPSPQAIAVPVEVENARVDATRQAAEEQARRFDPEGTWDVSLLVGQPGDAIARFVRENNAGLLVIGANKHSVWGRIFGEETAMEIARTVDVPLFIAAQDLQRLPKRVLVSMDIKPFGLENLTGVLTSISETKIVSCVHVKPRADFMGLDWADYDREYEVAMQERFATIEKMLQKAGISADLIVRHGDVTRELGDFAEFAKAELLVVGINRKRGMLRATSGRLAGRMLRRLATSILILPTPVQGKVRTEFPHDGVTEVLRSPEHWGKALKAFSMRNAGRVCNLEVDDPEFGALLEARAYPLLGVDYDHKDGRLTIMIGDSQGTERHLVRSVPSPDSVSVLSVGGRDTALSVAHGAGQTILSF